MFKEKKILAERAISRAESGLLFLEACLRLIHKGGTDPVFSRSMYILLSYNFELILKSRILLASNESNEGKLIAGIKSHKLKELSKKLSTDELKSIDIQGIEQKKDSGFAEYVIKLINGDAILIQELVDVRYDFTKDQLRGVVANEATRMKQEVQKMKEMIKKIRAMLN